MTDSPSGYRACILAGGLGTRLGQLTATTPKCLLPIAGTPFLGILMRKLAREGCRSIIVLTGHLHEQVDWYVAQTEGESILRRVPVSTLRNTGGTAPAILAALRLLDRHDDPVLCVNGDTILDVDFSAVVAAHIGTQADATIVTTDATDVPNPGAVVVDGEDTVVAFEEGGSQMTDRVRSEVQVRRVSNCGCYCLCPTRTLRALQGESVVSFEREALPYLVERATVKAFSIGTRLFLDYGVPERWGRLESLHPQIARIYHLRSQTNA